jgi:hypothetical protein
MKTKLLKRIKIYFVQDFLTEFNNSIKLLYIFFEL